VKAGVRHKEHIKMTEGTPTLCSGVWHRDPQTITQSISCRTSSNV